MALYYGEKTGMEVPNIQKLPRASLKAVPYSRTKIAQEKKSGHDFIFVPPLADETTKNDVYDKEQMGASQAEQKRGEISNGKKKLEKRVPRHSTALFYKDAL